MSSRKKKEEGLGSGYYPEKAFFAQSPHEAAASLVFGSFNFALASSTASAIDIGIVTAIVTATQSRSSKTETLLAIVSPFLSIRLSLLGVDPPR